MTDAEPDVTAAELALGVLDGDERAAALRRVLAEPAFAAEVDWWRDRLAALYDQTPEAEPAPALFDRVERSLDDKPAAVRTIRPRTARLFWPSIAALSSMAAAVLAVALVQRPPAPLQPAPIAPAPSTPLLAAALTPADKGEPLSAVYDPQAGTVRLSAATLADARHVAQLWVIGGDGVPYSLGLLRAGAASALPISPDARGRLNAQAVLAVSVEPLGGSPTGKPTGPVVAKGALAIT